MKSNRFKGRGKLSFSSLFLILQFFLGFCAHAIVPLPQPPLSNPHPAQTAMDKKRVAFAETAIEELLAKPLPKGIPRVRFDPRIGTRNKDLPCLRSIECFGLRDPVFLDLLLRLHDEYGEVAEKRHPHIIPWSFEKFQARKNDSTTFAPIAEGTQKRHPEQMGPQLRKDEYLIHVYVRYSKAGNWHHLDVILSEDEKGNLYLRSFYTIPMDYPRLPPGVEC